MKWKLRGEIGSEFWDIPLAPQENGIFPPHTVWYLSGRVALRAILSDLCARQVVRTAALPSWCCHTMIAPFSDAGIKVFFYPVFVADGVLRQEQGSCPSCDVTLVMDYFGYPRKPFTPDGGIVIYDATHGIFSGVPEGVDYVFGSLRKWAGFPTGGFAFSCAGELLPSALEMGRTEEYILLRRTAMCEKQAYLCGETNEKCHLAAFSSAEEMLDLHLSGGAGQADILAARFLDVPFLRQRRRENAAELLDYVREWAVFPELSAGDCPLFVPIHVPADRRNALHRHLIEKEIYCPVHWPVSELHRFDARTRDIYDTEISLICDQRYGLPEMHRIGQTVRAFLERERKP